MLSPWIFFVLLIVLAAGCSRGGPSSGAAKNDPSQDSVASGLVAGESLDAFDSTFTDQFGHLVTLGGYNGRPTLIAMIYTRCPSACPLLLASLQKIEKSLPADQGTNTWFVLVTLDPDHDTPDTLLAFAKARGLNDSRWRLLRGSRDATSDLAAILGVKVRDDGKGALAHSSNIYLLDDRGVIRKALVGLGADPAQMVAARAALGR